MPRLPGQAAAHGPVHSSYKPATLSKRHKFGNMRSKSRAGEIPDFTNEFQRKMSSSKSTTAPCAGHVVQGRALPAVQLAPSGKYPRRAPQGRPPKRPGALLRRRKREGIHKQGASSTRSSLRALMYQGGDAALQAACGRIETCSVHQPTWGNGNLSRCQRGAPCSIHGVGTTSFRSSTGRAPRS